MSGYPFLLTEKEARVIVAGDDHAIVLCCSDCETYFVPGPMKRYGDQACPRCGSLSTGFVSEETL
jgi:uncharacterized paraquat-inducible protein A